jgi:hypothetical protein
LMEKRYIRPTKENLIPMFCIGTNLLLIIKGILYVKDYLF